MKANWGLKRHCPSCSNPYYDLGKNPATCPKCKFVYDINVPVKPRRSKSKLALVPKAAPVPVKEKPKPVVKAKKPIKQIEGVDLGEFEDIAIEGEEEIEEIEEIEDIDDIEEIEEAEDEMDDDITLEDDDIAGKTLIDEVEEEEEGDEEEDEEEEGKSKSKSKGRAKPKPKPKTKAKPAKKKK